MTERAIAARTTVQGDQVVPVRSGSPPRELEGQVDELFALVSRAEVLAHAILDSTSSLRETLGGAPATREEVPRLLEPEPLGMIEAAQILGVHPRTLRRRIARLPPERRPRAARPDSTRPGYWWPSAAHVRAWYADATRPAVSGSTPKPRKQRPPSTPASARRPPAPKGPANTSFSILPGQAVKL